MRLSRIVAALVALVLAATMSQTLLSPAQAVQAKPKHELKAKGVELGGGNTNKFAIRGKIKTLPSGKVTVRRSVGGGPYRTYKKINPKANGKFSTRVYQVGRKRTCFQVQAPSTSTYKKTTVKIGCIVVV
jgi:hypothetical protein